MKKLTLIGTVVLLVSLMTVAFASADNTTPTPANSSAGVNFVDEDGDGLCDLCGGMMGRYARQNNGLGINFVDEDGDGVCDNCGSLFVDEDGDGVCDNCGTMNQYGRRLGGQGQMMGNRTGQPGLNFIDEDGDGVCDLMGEGGRQQGMQFRGQGRLGFTNTAQP